MVRHGPCLLSLMMHQSTGPPFCTAFTCCTVLLCSPWAWIAASRADWPWQHVCGSTQQALRDWEDGGSRAGCRSRGSRFWWSVLCSVQSFQRLSPLTQQTMVSKPLCSVPRSGAALYMSWLCLAQLGMLLSIDTSCARGGHVSSTEK